MLSIHKVLSTPQVRNQFLMGLKTIAIQDLSSAWRKYIPKYFALNDPFRYNKRAIKYYQESVNEFYQKDNALLPIEIFEVLFEAGLWYLAFYYYTLRTAFVSRIVISSVTPKKKTSYL